MHIKKLLNILYYSGAARLGKPVLGGMGAILMLHHVKPEEINNKSFNPNGGLEITPEFLEAVIHYIRAQGMDIISLDEMVARVVSPSKNKRRFVVFTLDDAPRDNYLYAYPIFKKHHCPFVIYATTQFLDGVGTLWWRILEAVIRQNTAVAGQIGDRDFSYQTVSRREKKQAWKQIYWPVRHMNQYAQSIWVKDLGARYGVDWQKICQDISMRWPELIQLANEPLCTVGAHTLNHYALAQLEPAQAILELKQSKQILEAKLGRDVKHFAYPYGDPTSAGLRDFNLAQEAGFLTAVTTRKGMMFPAHANHLLALPRLSLSGSYQNLRYVEVLLSGVAFGLHNRFARLNVV